MTKKQLKDFAGNIGGDDKLELTEGTVADLMKLLSPSRTDGDRGDVPESLSFAKFFSDLSQSVVQAQHSLDMETERYLQLSAGKPHILPTLFRMPKVSANMKFALEVTKGSGVNLLFFQRKNESVSKNEQGIDFEIVSVPAPPDALQLRDRFLPMVDLVVNPVERRSLAKLIGSIQPDALRRPVVDAANQTPHRLVMVGVPAPAGQDRSWLVWFATDKTDNSIGMWRLSTAKEMPAVLETIYSFGKNNGEGEAILRNLILDIANQQEKLGD